MIFGYIWLNLDTFQYIYLILYPLEHFEILMYLDSFGYIGYFLMTLESFRCWDNPLLADSNSVSSIKNTFANCISLLLDTFTREGKGLEISEAPRTTSLVVVAKGTLGNERGWNQAFLLCAWPISDVGQQKLKACCPNVVTYIIHFCSSKNCKFPYKNINIVSEVFLAWKFNWDIMYTLQM